MASSSICHPEVSWSASPSRWRRSQVGRCERRLEALRRRAGVQNVSPITTAAAQQSLRRRRPRRDAVLARGLPSVRLMRARRPAGASVSVSSAARSPTARSCSAAARQARESPRPVPRVRRGAPGQRSIRERGQLGDLLIAGVVPWTASHQHGKERYRWMRAIVLLQLDPRLAFGIPAGEPRATSPGGNPQRELDCLVSGQGLTAANRGLVALVA